MTLTLCTFWNIDSCNCKLISGANEPLQRWEMCIETLQRFMGFALATMQDQAMDETDRHAAINVVSMVMNSLGSLSGVVVAVVLEMYKVLCLYKVNYIICHHCHHHHHHCHYHCRHHQNHHYCHRQRRVLYCILEIN